MSRRSRFWALRNESRRVREPHPLNDSDPGYGADPLPDLTHPVPLHEQPEHLRRPGLSQGGEVEEFKEEPTRPGAGDAS